MIQFDNVTLRRGTQILLHDLSMTITARAKVGLVGANGSGKSSLLALLRGQLEPDAGSCTLPPNAKLAYVAQETPASEDSAIDYVIAGDEAYTQLQTELAAAIASDDGPKISRLQQQLEDSDGYTIRARASKILRGLGFQPSQLDQPVNYLSGGWRMRLNLARALLAPSDIMLLDEPTNHLDLDAIIWLEGCLRSYNGLLLLVSHDRDFLDAVIEQVLHIENQQAFRYTGNYSAFEGMRGERLAQQRALKEKQDREAAHMQAFIARFRAQATKARQAQSRIKALARMEIIAAAQVDSPFHFQFSDPGRLPNPLLTFDKAQIGYPDKVVLRNVDIFLSPGSRVGLLGLNGAGKSTLVKSLAQETTVLAGVTEFAKELRCGYFAQHQLEQLDPGASALQHVQRLSPRESEQRIRDFLGGFDFAGNRATAPVAPLSGGEKSRLVLALLVWQKPNLLLLDEPTNHLDLQMREALTMALQEFAGALVVVSHDRHLLRSVCDEFWLVADGAVTPFDGDLDDYAKWLQQRSNDNPAASEPATPTSGPSRRDERRNAAVERQRLAPLKQSAKSAEQRVTKAQTRKEAIEKQLADTTLYEESRKSDLKKLLAERTAIEQELSVAEHTWLELLEQVENAEKASSS